MQRGDAMNDQILQTYERYNSLTELAAQFNPLSRLGRAPIPFSAAAEGYAHQLIETAEQWRPEEGRRYGERVYLSIPLNDPRLGDITHYSFLKDHQIQTLYSQLPAGSGRADFIGSMVLATETASHIHQTAFGYGASSFWLGRGMEDDTPMWHRDSVRFITLTGTPTRWQRDGSPADAFESTIRGDLNIWSDLKHRAPLKSEGTGKRLIATIA